MLSRYGRRSFRAEGEILRTLAHEGSRNESRSAGLLSPTPLPLCVFPTLPLYSIKLLVSVHSQFEQQIEELFVWRIGSSRSQNKQGKKKWCTFHVKCELCNSVWNGKKLTFRMWFTLKTFPFCIFRSSVVNSISTKAGYWLLTRQICTRWKAGATRLATEFK